MANPIKHDTAGAIILTDTQPRRVLLVHHRKFDQWMQPGGHVEADENPFQAALRETQEEAGIDITPYMVTPVIFDDHVSQLPIPQYILEERINARGDEPEHYHIDSLYVVRMPQQAVAHSQAESHGIGWFTLEETEDLPLFDNVRILLRQEMTK